MPVSGRMKQWACSAALLLTCAGGVVTHFKAVRRQESRLDSAQQELARLREANAITAQSPAELAQARRALSRFAKDVTKEVELGSLLQPLEQDLKDSAVPGREITTRSTTPGPHLTRTALSLRFRGSFERMFSFARQLENSNVPVRIDSVTAERSSGDASAPLQVEIEFSTFTSTSEELIRWATAE